MRTAILLIAAALLAGCSTINTTRRADGCVAEEHRAGRDVCTAWRFGPDKFQRSSSWVRS